VDPLTVKPHEAAGWTTHFLSRKSALDLQDQAAEYAGAPADSTSRWSFGRWEQATNGDAARLEALFTHDRSTFYDMIASDPELLAGWSGDPVSTRSPFSNLWDKAGDRLDVSHYAASALWINHVASAVDALCAARLNNLPLGKDTRLGLSSGWQRGTPTFHASLRRSF